MAATVIAVTPALKERFPEVERAGRAGSWGQPIDLVEHGIDTMAGEVAISPDGKYLFSNANAIYGGLIYKSLKN